MARSVYQGTIGNDKEGARSQVAAQWALYEKSARLTGDILMWEYGGASADALKQELGYFEHEESATYEEHEHTETKQEVNYKRDCYETVKVYTPVAKEYSEKKCIKVVKRGTRDRVKALEEAFILDAQNYFIAKKGISSEMPSKALSVAYNIFLLLSGLFFIAFFICSPAVLSDYAQSLSADILLLKLFDGYVDMAAQIPSWLCYVSFALSLVCFCAFFYVCSRYEKFTVKPNSRKTIYGFFIIIVAFGLGFLMNDGYRELMESNNPLLWIPFGAFCASRAGGFLTSVYFVISSAAHLFTGYPHKQVSQGVEQINDYIESGRYQKSCDTLREIISYSVHADVEKIMKIFVKIAELETEKDRLVHIQETEFVDKSSEIAELNARIKKARSKIDELTHIRETAAADKPADIVESNAKIKRG